MIQGSSRLAYRVHGTNQFVSHGLKENYQTDTIRVDVNFVDGVELDIEAFKKWRNGEYADAEFILEDGSISPLSLLTGQAGFGEGQGVRSKYICGSEVEKMSKSKFNTVNPDDLVLKYGADTFRMYEMFLGPVEQSKPWDTKGIEGVHRFLKKLWRLFYSETPLSFGEGAGERSTSLSFGEGLRERSTPLSARRGVGGEAATESELKILHKAIKKIEDDTERLSFNTAVSAFMVAVNEIADAKCNKREILEPLLIMLAPYAPHIAEELWQALGNTTSILDAAYPILNEKYLVESSKMYPVSINGKLRTTIDISLDAEQAEIEKIVLSNDTIKKWMEDKPVKKFIFVKNKMVNVVI
jgi:leucyl-tRNA synthetase